MRQLNPRLGPRYYADVEVTPTAEEVHVAATGEARSFVADAGVLERTRVPLETVPASTAVALPQAPVRREVRLAPREKLRAVHIRETRTGRLVTSIELLSPWNKRRGQGLEACRYKRELLLQSPVHLIEVDLLRDGERPGVELSSPPLECEYVIVVNRANGGAARTSEIWPVTLRERLPAIPVPLRHPGPDVALDLQEAVTTVYHTASYRRRIDYAEPPPPPPLRGELEAWLRDTLRPRLEEEAPDRGS